LRTRPVVAGRTVADVLYRAVDRDFRIFALGWLDKAGPFWEQDRLQEAEDLFQVYGIDVTEQGLGEAARRVKADDDAVAFSFRGGELYFSGTRIVVMQGFESEPIAMIDVRNFVAVDELASYFDQAAPEPSSWGTLLDACRTRFDTLCISADIDGRLERETFQATVRDGVSDLLGVLHDFMKNRTADGRLSDHGMEILRNYFMRGNAWFSDESATNKRLFRTAMTFVDPADPSRSITCFWHGKIQTPQYRVHFEWPVPIGQSQLKVTYIGPKISRR